MGKRKERDAVVFLNEQLKMACEVMEDDELGRLIRNLRAYSMEGKEADLEHEGRLFRSIYGMMKSAQDKVIANYEATCERNRNRVLKRYNTATAGNRSYQSNLIKSNQITGFDDPLDREGTGVPGIGWLE